MKPQYKIQSWMGNAPEGFSPYRLGLIDNKDHTFPSDEQIIEVAQNTLRKKANIIIATRAPNYLLLHIPLGGISRVRKNFLDALSSVA